MEMRNLEVTRDGDMITIAQKTLYNNVLIYVTTDQVQLLIDWLDKLASSKSE